MTSAGPTFLVVGRIGRPHGVRGEVEVQVWTDFPERFRPGSRLYVGKPDGSDSRPVAVLAARPHHDRLLVRLDLAADRTAAGALTGLHLLVPATEAMPLEADAYYHHQLVGLAVVLPDGSAVGDVTEVLETGSADVLVVQGPQGEVLLPMIGAVIASVDLAAGRLLITPIPGLLEAD